MSGFASHSFRLFAVFAALSVFTGQGQAAGARLQQVADEAALAAVQALAANNASDEASRHADAVKAARQIISPIPGVAAEVSASVTDMVVTVKLSATDAKTPAVSTARYVPPEQPAVWAWAARQRFAFKSSPVVVGSTCPQGCDPVR